MFMDTIHKCLYSPGMNGKKGRGPLGHNVLHLRKLLDLTRPEIARAIGIDDDQQIYALEARNSSRSDLAPQLADFFGVDLETLLTQDLSVLTLAQIRDLNNRKARAARPSLKVIGGNEDRDSISGARMIRLFELFMQSTDEGRQGIIDAAELAPKTIAHGTTASNKPK